MNNMIYILSNCAFLRKALQETICNIDMNFSIDDISNEKYEMGGKVLFSLYDCISPLQRIKMLDRFRFFANNPKWDIIVAADSCNRNSMQLAHIMGVPILDISLPLIDFQKEYLTWLLKLDKPSDNESLTYGSLGRLTAKEWRALTCMVRGVSLQSLSIKKFITTKTLYNQRYISLHKIGMDTSRRWHSLLV